MSDLLYMSKSPAINVVVNGHCFSQPSFTFYVMLILCCFTFSHFTFHVKLVLCCFWMLRQIGKDRQLDYDPCFLSWFAKGEFLLAGGSNKQCNVYSRDGVQLGVVGDLPSWVWSAEVRPDANCVVSTMALLTSFSNEYLWVHRPISICIVWWKISLTRQLIVVKLWH